jgi:hypothetical protein
MSAAFRSTNVLIIVALATDLVTPFLVWKGVLPGYTRWLSHAAVALMMIGAYVRMMVYDRVPVVAWVIVWVSAAGLCVALLRGQGIGATAWGWWLMFQYPLVGLFAYLQPRWPKDLPRLFRTTCVAILAAELVIQIVQYSAGETVGDNLSGTFGEHGTAKLLVFVSFVICLALGQWLAAGEWRTLVFVLAVGTVSAVLGEIKAFPVIALMLVMIAMVLFTIRNGQIWKLVPYVALIAGVVWAYAQFYNSIVPAALGAKPLQAYLEPGAVTEYLGGVSEVPGEGEYSGRYHMGRNYALNLGWNAIRQDVPTFLFGMGLGARGESSTLGTAGVALLEGGAGLSTGTSLLVMMQELGVVGMVILGLFVLWTVTTLMKGIDSRLGCDKAELRYALVLFSLLWPLWLWYSTVWTFRVPMLLYWASLGYVLGASRGARTDLHGSHGCSVALEHWEKTRG